jgi:16S rRNA (guanine527-N7)-methyltransferase
LYKKDLEFLRKTAVDFGINLSWPHVDRVGIYLNELIQWNRSINLIGLSNSERIINELFLDSLIPAPFLPGKGRMLDIGSGAGFPGMVLKIYYPGLKTHLLEPNSKKRNFLKQIIRLLDLDDISVISGRIEMECKNFHPEGYNIITARALAGLYKIIEWCSPFLTTNGLLVGFLGSKAENELEKARKPMEDYSLTLERLLPYSLPGKNSKRNIVILKK